MNLVRNVYDLYVVFGEHFSLSEFVQLIVKKAQVICMCKNEDIGYLCGGGGLIKEWSERASSLTRVIYLD